jgi:hypothetical protein
VRPDCADFRRLGKIRLSLTYLNKTKFSNLPRIFNSIFPFLRVHIFFYFARLNVGLFLEHFRSFFCAQCPEL